MNNQLTIIEKYTLKDIENVLSEILDEYELKQVLNDFRRYKSIDIIPEVIEEKFVLPERYYVRLKTKEQLTYTSKVLKLHWSWFEGGGYINRPSGNWLDKIEGTPVGYTEITFEQFEEYVLDKQEVTLPF